MAQVDRGETQFSEHFAARIVYLCCKKPWAGARAYKRASPLLAPRAQFGNHIPTSSRLLHLRWAHVRPQRSTLSRRRQCVTSFSSSRNSKARGDGLKSFVSSHMFPFSASKRYEHSRLASFRSLRNRSTDRNGNMTEAKAILLCRCKQYRRTQSSR